MNKINPAVDAYLNDGCGRCAYFKTPQCKVHSWSEELKQLRRIAIECGLQEELKWSQPCYTSQKKNILMVTAFKAYASLAFFKGALLSDPQGILIAAGEHSQSSRQLRFASVKEIIDLEPILKEYIVEAVRVEQAGLNVKLHAKTDPIPEELQQKLNENQAFRMAFEALTPGRQRGYKLYFSQPKKPLTRITRIEKYMDKILNGEGLNDRYKRR